MAKEIAVNVTALETELTKLTSMKSTWAAGEKKAPARVGEGGATQALEELGQVYELIYAEMQQMMQNTIGFLTNIKTSYLQADANAAKAMSK